MPQRIRRVEARGAAGREVARDGAGQAMIELMSSELAKPAADRAKRREERLKAAREGREHEEPEEEK